MAKKQQSTPESESEVHNVISAFEQILDAEPNDRIALETLYEAYDKISDQVNALKYLVRLAQVVTEEGDMVSAPMLLKKLEKVGGEDEAVKAVAEGLKQLVASKPQEPEEEKPPAPVKPKRRTDITNELSLAWNLLQAEEITQDDYTNIVQDLSDSSTKKIDTPITVLHVLEDRQFKTAPKILTHMSKDSGLPVVALEQFEFQVDVCTRIPLDFSVHRGALMFEVMGGEALVAILNPYDMELRGDIEQLLGMKCHFYLVPAGVYDVALGRIRQLIAEKKSEGAAG